MQPPLAIIICTANSYQLILVQFATQYCMQIYKIMHKNKVDMQAIELYTITLIDWYYMSVCVITVGHWPNTKPISSVATQITHTLTQWPPKDIVFNYVQADSGH